MKGVIAIDSINPCYRNPYVVLPKLKQKKVYYSEKYEQQQERFRSRNNSPLPPIGGE